jgi:geranylgeranyl diphosphate synthase type II
MERKASLMDFKEELKGYQQLVNKELDNYVRKQKCPEEILNRAMEYSLMAGGKRLRPILVIATYKLFKQDIEKCMPYAVAIEMVHNFSLIHDDLPGIDNDDFRHGKLTNHKQFNEATAILAGDGLFNYAYMVISQDLRNSSMDELPNKLKIFEEFSKATDRMIAGEYIDTELEKQKITEETLKYIHENKTGALLKLCVRMGAILADCEEIELQKLSNYAEKIGLAFQIKDDILSEEGNEEILGKPVGNDRELGKCTYVSQYGLEGAKEILDNITKEAIKELEEFGEKADFLKELALYIQTRNK